MGKISPFVNLWQIMREADLRPLREAALNGVAISVIGAPGSGRQTLVNAMRQDPHRSGQQTASEVQVLDLDGAAQAAKAELVILMMDSRRPDSAREQALVQQWHSAGKKVLVFINQHQAPELAAGAATAALPAATQAPDALPPDGSPAVVAGADMGGANIGAANAGALTSAAAPVPAPLRKLKEAPAQGRRRRGVVWGSAQDTRFLLESFAPAVMELLPDHLLGLGRAFPLFRVPIARYLIHDTSFSNATYAFTTALAETFAIANVPIVVADTFVLTKNQLFLAYKVGLTLGYSTRWQDYIAEFSGVLGSGFLFRQAARALIGLVPVIGILPKTAVAYAGTSVTGNAVLQWYLTGRHISPDQIKTLYREALTRGKKLGNLLRRRRSQAALPAPDGSPVAAKPSRWRLPSLRRKK